MRPDAALDRLAALAGLTTRYIDGLGIERRPTPDSVLAVLRALGYDLSSIDEAPRLVDDLDSSSMAGSPAMLVSFDRDPIPLVVGDAERDSPIELTLTTVTHETVTWTQSASTAGPVARVAIPGQIPDGVHRLDIVSRSSSRSTWLAVAPRRIHRGPLAGDVRQVGAFLPLYAAHTQRSWGIGDLTDLAELGHWSANRGIGVVGTLPLLAAFLDRPFEPSPYVPVSRRFWNELYLDIDALEATWWPQSAKDLADRYRLALRADRRRYVDLETVARVKREVVEAAYLDGDVPASVLDAIDRYAATRPESVAYARFRARGERFGTDWRRWPSDDDADAHGDRAMRYHLIVQSLFEEQIRRVAASFRADGTTLYLDLPLGCHPDGFDRWADAEQYVDGISLGAPPDAFFPRGQSWGLPPRHPAAGHLDGYAALAADLDHHLGVAGLLRIDHVMGLHRCFWVPDGADATDGVYVQYPSTELMAVISAASHRHQAGIVGEDLGTVPDEVRSLVDDHGLLGMYVALFGTTNDARRPLHRPRPSTVASLSTHDLPTFPGWWSGRDIDDRLQLALIDRAEADAEVAERATLRLGLAEAAGRSGDDTTPQAALAAQRAALAELASSDAALVLVDLEGLWGETEPQNVPGTVSERRNWRRRASVAVDRFEDHQAIPSAIEQIVPRPRPDRVSDALVSTDDLHLFHEGRHFDLHDRFGAQLVEVDGHPAVSFAAWAPDADSVAVIGSFNDWDDTRHPMTRLPESGVWATVIGSARTGDAYKYRIRSRHGGYQADKSDPVGATTETSPSTASMVWRPRHRWDDGEWMSTRGRRQGPGTPMSITEVHLGSWRRDPARPHDFLDYRALAPLLAEHCRELGFTHVELMPVMEHPYYPSWGYQLTGYFAPSSRWGTPDDFAYLVDHLHQNDIGVICDWVPSHFPSDAHGLGYFDGTYLYEHADPRQRIHPEWASLQFNYGRHEVRSFLISSAMCWLDRFHVDGLRVDAVASMLYLDYGREPGEWVPNRYGGRENLDAVRFLQDLNTAVYARHPDVVMIAEESTAWPGVTRPVHEGGLGFGFKWDMGWMHDSLDYLSREPVHRRWHHNELTFRSMYQDAEHYVLPLSHDEVVHEKGSLLGRMPGDEWQRFANVRLLLAWHHTAPGVPMLFMGEEMAPYDEWNHDRSLHWHLLDNPAHAGVARWVAHLNHLRPVTPALYELDRDPAGFEWIDADDSERSIYSFVRHSQDGSDSVLVVLNATPVPRAEVTFGVPRPGLWRTIANGDDPTFGGSGYPMASTAIAGEPGAHSRRWALTISVPPLAAVVLRWER